jgi:ketosteroid isomerase-like protein
MEAVRQIRDIVAAINSAWTSGRYEEIGQYVSDQVVMAPPGLNGRVMGREAYVASFRQFAEVARTRIFDPGVPRVDVMGGTAVATCPFSIRYEMEGQTYQEKGFDILVFAFAGGAWKVVWRTLLSEPAPQE